MSFIITDQRTGDEFRRTLLKQAKLLAYERVIPLVHDNLQLGREIRRIYNWKGKGMLTIRYGNEFLSLYPA
jgi:hypothetical protein